ncbi:MAG: sigma-54 dependent transcriptional regulator [Marinifilaceae bacterium]|jgi:transcriptional regulator with PAS, ATPase and Fis domain|nr:sigma-54-dependent Fis family transcriptional regulator [Marinilabiliaceae bacterium JC040]MCT4600786.1 sigma-54 dependent transcriptional regulator [Marinifilaceae bacterium]
MEIQAIKQKFGIIGNSNDLNRAIDVAIQVAPTDLSVLITGESGTGKEVFPQIIHSNSARKHGQYIAVNCGAIPEGTIDSELFGHEKGSFTGALSDRKGYFEEANGGTIFLDEIGELPLSTQVRLLRVLEVGEIIRVGSSSPQKVNVRVVGATNVNLLKAIKEGKFREDLYYRLNTIPISVPPLRERKDDIKLLFRKFAMDVAEKYRMPIMRLAPETEVALANYRWPGNVRQLKNVTEQISVLEKDREISLDVINKYIPTDASLLPMISPKSEEDKTFSSEREVLYKVLFDMKKDMNELKQLVFDFIDKEKDGDVDEQTRSVILQKLSKEGNVNIIPSAEKFPSKTHNSHIEDHRIMDTEEVIEESLSLEDKEKELILKALEKYQGKRKDAAKELGISERTLYRKIKEYNINK